MERDVNKQQHDGNYYCVSPGLDLGSSSATLNGVWDFRASGECKQKGNVAYYSSPFTPICCLVGGGVGATCVIRRLRRDKGCSLESHYICVNTGAPACNSYWSYPYSFLQLDKGSPTQAIAFAMSQLILLYVDVGLLTNAGPPSAREHLQDMVSKTPSPPDFSTYFQALPELGRKVVVAAPCIGIHASGHAFSEMSVPSTYNNIFDLDERYHMCLKKHMLEIGMQVHEIELNLGKTVGDLLRCPLKKLSVPVDFLIAGPPCPPWAGNGTKKGLRDARARVFVQVMVWLLFFVRCGGLLGVILENVSGILSSWGGLEPAISKFERVS